MNSNLLSNKRVILPQTGDSELSPIAEVGLLTVLAGAGAAAGAATRLRKKEF